MSTAVVDTTSPTRRRPSAPSTPTRRRAPVGGPLARPERSASMPPARLADGVVRGCRANLGTVPSAPWRLTDRGIALVLILAAILVVAAVTVIGLTAWRVTGAEYQTTGVSELSWR